MKRALSVVAIAALGANAWARDDVYIPLPFLNADESQVQIAAVMPFGQTFVPSRPTVGTIWLSVRNMNVGYPYERDKRLTLRLRTGADFSGAVLASSSADVEAVIGTLLGGEGLIAFYFEPLAVISGQTYSFEVQASTARYGVNWQHNDWYGSGNAIALGGSIPGSDLYFGVSAAVPEVDVHQLFLLGVTFAIGLPFGRARLARRCSS